MTLLVLGGTGEAKEIAQQLADTGVDAIVSLAGATRDPADMPIRSRTGGFGGAEGFRSFVAESGITAVLDATHPYASKITNRTAEICQDLSLPYLQLLRPAWVAGEGDDWTEIATEEEAARYIHKWQTVFLGTGRQTLEKFKNLEGSRVLCRLIDPPTAPFPFEGGEFLIGRPPFSVERELELFRALIVDWVVVKNAGGEASKTKLTAAREMGLPVLMIRRPEMPDAPRVETVAEAMTWVNNL
jgi:precorrin-6A/cobalt-precorrin-6A reductase